MDLVSTREGLLEVGKRRKVAIGKGRRMVIATGKGKGTRTGREVRIGTEKRIVTVIEIVIGNEVRGGIGEEIGMMLIITEVKTLTGSVEFWFLFSHDALCSYC